MSDPIKATPGPGYNRRDGRFVDADSVVPLPSQVFPAGITIGQVFELGDKRTLSLALATSAQAGTNPTLDVTLETSHDAVTDWQSVGTFRQQTGIGLAMSAVAENGTTPPDVTLSGTPLVPMDLRVECTTLGARGTSKIRYSLDGGVTFVESDVTTAATILLKYLDATGTLVTTGVTMAMENAAAAVNNYWTAKTAGYERKRFTGLGRFGRLVANVGGSSTPTVTAGASGEAV